MQKIDELKQQIQAFEHEISRLEKELAVVGGRTLQLVSGDSNASAISKSIRSEAQRVIEQQPIIQVLRSAIAELTTRSNQKKSQLQELEKEQQKQARVKRVETAKQKLREQVEKIDDIASLLESAYYDLKAIYKEANPDFKALGSAAPGSYAYGMHQLIHFEFLRLPVLTEKNDSFFLSGRNIDLFGIEQKAEQEEQAARSRKWRENHEREMAEIKQRETQQRSRIEQEERQLLLSSKRSELAEFKAARTERLSSLATANVSYFDSAIAKLEAEIENLQ